MDRLRSPAALAIALLAAGAAAPRPLVAVGELSCGGQVTPAGCDALTDRLVDELAAAGPWEVVREAELRKSRARCDGDPRCLAALRREPARVVSGTVLPRGGGYQVRLRLLDARTLEKRGEAAATATNGDPRTLGDAVARAARDLPRGR